MHVSGCCGPSLHANPKWRRLADADILNYKMKNTVRRNDGTSVREEGEKQVERDMGEQTETKRGIIERCTGPLSRSVKIVVVVSVVI